MKRMMCCLIAVILSLLLTGCNRHASPLRIVTRVDVTADRGYQILRRQYTQPEKISMVLNYLRRQKNLGDPNVDPELVLGDKMQIDVTMSDGTHRLYYQQSGRFLSEKNKSWHMIDPEMASNFDFRLQMIPTDAKPPARRQGDHI